MTFDKALIVFVIGSFAVACANSPTPPREELAAAELAVRQVQGTIANDHAPADVRQADRKLEAARSAMQREDYVQARRMAEQALVDAQFADAKADAARSGEILALSRDNVETLEREALELSR